MGKYSGILLCSDLDGTLTNSRGEISKENVQAICELREHGGVFCVSTGRLPHYLRENYSDKIELDGLAICCNGACIYDFGSNTAVYERFLGKGYKDIIDFLFKDTEHIAGLYMYCGLERIVFENETLKKDKVYAALRKPVYKAVVCGDTEESTVELKAKLAKRFGGGFDFSRSWATGLEILDAAGTKGHAVRRLCDMIGGIEKVICVGDYENDITMLKAADIGCAVSNAVSGLKDAADRVICSGDEHAIRYIVDRIDTL